MYSTEQCRCISQRFTSHWIKTIGPKNRTHRSTASVDLEALANCGIIAIYRLFCHGFGHIFCIALFFMYIYLWFSPCGLERVFVVGGFPQIGLYTNYCFSIALFMRKRFLAWNRISCTVQLSQVDVCYCIRRAFAFGRLLLRWWITTVGFGSKLFILHSVDTLFRLLSLQSNANDTIRLSNILQFSAFSKPYFCVNEDCFSM